jgi:hypothetical protein
MAAAVLVMFQNCAPAGFSSRTPSSETQMSGGTTTDNPKPTIDVMIKPHSVAAIQNATICVEDVKFRKASRLRIFSTEAKAMKKAAADLTSRLKGRDITIFKEGTFIDSFELPRGDYNLVELVLDDDCQADKSLTVINAGGAYGAKEHLTLRFDGNGSGGGILQLNMQAYLDVLTHVRSNSDIRRALDGVRGSF